MLIFPAERKFNIKSIKIRYFVPNKGINQKRKITKKKSAKNKQNRINGKKDVKDIIYFDRLLLNGWQYTIALVLPLL